MRAAWLWVVRVLALSAGVIAVYLWAVSWSSRQLPVGCGPGSGCEAVLGSRWASVGGVPVSGLAAIIYAGMLAATFLIGPERPVRVQRAAWAVLVGGGTAVVTAAAWFIGLQVFVVQAGCGWCLADHALGGALATAVLCRAPALVLGGGLAPGGGARGLAWPLVLAAGIGSLGACGLAVSQMLWGSAGGSFARLPAEENADSGPGPRRRISVLRGDVELLPHELPVLGSADAPKLLVVLFDYCCPHCRAMHRYLEAARGRYGDQVAVVLLPTPLNPRCNSHIPESEPRFEHACELSRLALAVWRAQPRAFAEFDRWLFEPELPRTPEEARAKAAQLVSPGQLQAALSDAWIDAQIARNVAAYGSSGMDRVPVVMSPGFASIVGRVDSEEALYAILERELDVRVRAAVRSSTGGE